MSFSYPITEEQLCPELRRMIGAHFVEASLEAQESAVYVTVSSGIHLDPDWIRWLGEKWGDIMFYDGKMVIGVPTCDMETGNRLPEWKGLNLPGGDDDNQWDPPCEEDPEEEDSDPCIYAKPS